MGMLEDILIATETINEHYQRLFGGTPAIPPARGEALDHDWYNANNG